MTIKIDRMQLLSEWYQLSSQLKDLKDKEMRLRQEIVKYFFEDPKIGKNRFTLEDGFILEFDNKLNYTLDHDELLKICNSNEGVALKLNPGDCVKYKPEFNRVMFDNLPENKQELVSLCLTSKPASPVLAIVRGKK